MDKNDPRNGMLPSGEGSSTFTVRFGQILQLSQWSLRHRIEACRMLQDSTNWWIMSPLSRHAYAKQSLALIHVELKDIGEESTVPSLDPDGSRQSEYGEIELDPGVLQAEVDQTLVYQDWKQLTGFLEMELERVREEDKRKKWYTTSFRSEGSFQPEDLYLAVENGKVEDVEKMMVEMGGPEHWTSIRPQEYQGATFLHWAAVCGSVNVVSFIKQQMQDFTKGKEDTWNFEEILNSRDDFGFTPLHLAVFSSPPRSVCTNINKDDIERDAKRTVKLIDELYEMGATDIASSTSQSEFLVWNLGPGGIYLDDHLTNSNLYPMFLGVHLSQPRIVQKLVERFADQNFAKNIMAAGDSVLHCAITWERLIIEGCSNDEWNKIETALLVHLDNLPKAVKSRNFNRETPLHVAVRTKSLKWMEVLLQCEHVRFSLRDRDILTPGGRATKMWKDLNEGAAKKLKVSSEDATEMLQDSIEDAAKMYSGKIYRAVSDLDVKKLKDFREDAKEIQNVIDLIDSYDPESVLRKEKEQKQKERDKRERDEKRERQADKDYREEMLEDEKRMKQEEKEKRETVQKMYREERKEEREREAEAKRKRDRDDMAKEKKEAEAKRKRDRDDMAKEKKEENDRRRIEALQRDRQVYVDAANAILVGGALVASASFGAWLQPPLGFHPYYSPEYLDATAPPSVGPVYESFVAIQQYWIIHLFWVFNSLSFFFSLATVMAGADAALPKPGLIGSGSEVDVKDALKSVKNAVKRAAWLLILAIIFVICTFATLGFTVLPPITKYRINLIVTLCVGGLVCILFLIKLVIKLVSKEKKETPATTSSPEIDFESKEKKETTATTSSQEIDFEFR